MTSRRSNPILLLASTALLLALPGCMEMEGKQTINKDGSGTMTTTIVMDVAKIEQIKASFGPGMDIEGEDVEGDHKEELARINAFDGVKVVSATYSKDEETKKESTTVEIAFDSLEQYYKSGIDEGSDISLAQTEAGEWVLTQTMKVGDGEHEAPEGDDPQVEMMKGMLKAFMSDLKITKSVTVPGTIIETNGTKDEAGHTATWTLGFDDMFDAAKRTMTVKFKGEGLALKAFHVSAAEMDAAKEKLEAEIEKAKAESAKAAEKKADAPKQPAGG
jgi:hypothetical protein